MLCKCLFPEPKCKCQEAEKAHHRAHHSSDDPEERHLHSSTSSSLEAQLVYMQPKAFVTTAASLTLGDGAV